jgi:hypothetical protein
MNNDRKDTRLGEANPPASWRDALKLFIGVIIWWACAFASQAITANVDFTKLGEYGPIFGLPHLVSSQLWGYLLGALKGVPMAIQVVVMGYLGINYVPPFVSWSTRLAVSFIHDVRLAMRDKTDPSSDKTGDKS